MGSVRSPCTARQVHDPRRRGVCEITAIFQRAPAWRLASLVCSNCGPFVGGRRSVLAPAPAPARHRLRVRVRRGAEAGDEDYSLRRMPGRQPKARCAITVVYQGCARGAESPRTRPRHRRPPARRPRKAATPRSRAGAAW
eukprot:scaffold3719_cov247-Pinguiococcus_pyrenoidosus.AAC.19